MSVRSLGVLLLKVWGVIWVVSGLDTIVSLIGLAFNLPETAVPDQRYVVMSAGLSPLMTFVFGLLLVVLPERVIALIVPNDVDAQQIRAESYSLAEWQATAFGAVAVFFLISALRDIGTLVYSIARTTSWDQVGNLTEVFRNQQSELAGAAIQLVAAAVLLVKRSFFAQTWLRLRSRDIAAAAPENVSNNNAG